MSSAEDLVSYPPFFRPNQGVDNGQHPVESGSDSDSDSDCLPLIDLEALKPAYLSEVCREWGVFRLSNHGVPAELLSELQDHASKLFSLSFESKQALPTTPAFYFWGSAAITMSGNAQQTGPPSPHLNWLEGLNVPLSKISHSHCPHPLLESFR